MQKIKGSENMEIIKMTVDGNFSYIWLKTVDKVLLSCHCARCLVGEYDKNINSHVKHAENLKLYNKVYYLCGVSSPYKWGNNFHLAFKPQEGSIINYSSNGIAVQIKDAIQLPISEKYIDMSNKKASEKSFFTCRNWQFAHYFNKYIS